MAWFQDNDERAERLADIIFELRREMFRAALRRPGAFGVGEDERRRVEESLMEWDLETRRLILASGGLPAAPADGDSIQ